LLIEEGGFLASSPHGQARNLMAGAATGGRATGAGSAAAAGGRRELGSHFGIAGAHESLTVRFVTDWAFHLRIAAKYQSLKILAAVIAVKFKNGHLRVISLTYFSTTASAVKFSHYQHD
jgi:hypothetical protein